MNIDIQHLRQWIGSSETYHDCVTRVPVAALRALLDLDNSLPEPGEPLPPAWQWLYFLPLDKQSELSENGHARLGEFLPPVPLPLRMYAGGNMVFHHPLRIGDDISRTSTVADVYYREGRTGPLVFLKILHEISNQSGVAITEEQDIVYREHDNRGQSKPTYRQAPDNHVWQSEKSTDPAVLFRFSALTFNGHRIHYDYPYTTGVEGYPGLLVHGPLIAILLLDLLYQNMPDACVKEFRFRSMKPVFNEAPFLLCGGPEQGGTDISLWASDSKGHLCMDAGVILTRDH